MDNTQSNLISSYKLESEFLQNRVKHTRYKEKAKNKDGKVKEEWNDCGELGSGGFGVVYKQIQRATGNYRAVKTIHKRQASMLDSSMEVLVIAMLAKSIALASSFVKFLGWFEDP
ncbi:hypothetical protein B9Z19DRAFT_1134531 [Tuber borchii]|uniref:Protein kinase domain-containing protein n=1 Tax=Tuber borchii TaxID=42251 RepID=A0A2T6ZE31_TUBBO|nr:hypothetical protein B9Z19DRAFT_1134531 [Tuber borchii]